MNRLRDIMRDRRVAGALAVVDVNGESAKQ